MSATNDPSSPPAKIDPEPDHRVPNDGEPPPRANATMTWAASLADSMSHQPSAKPTTNPATAIAKRKSIVP